MVIIEKEIGKRVFVDLLVESSPKTYISVRDAMLFTNNATVGSFVNVTVHFKEMISLEVTKRNIVYIV